MRNVRRHFRLDVDIPVVIKLTDKDEVVRLLAPELTSGEWRAEEASYDVELELLSGHLAEENKLVGDVVADLIYRLRLLSDAILLTVQGRSVYDEIELYKTHRSKTSLAERLKPGVVIADILRSFNEKMAFYFKLIDKAIHKDYEDYIEILESEEFLFDTRYLTPLEDKAIQGNLLARVMVALNAKLERHVLFLIKYRQEVNYLVDMKSWPKRKLNLSAGGVGFVSELPYPKFARLTIEFRCLMNGRARDFQMFGNIVSARELLEGYYIAVEFTNATEPIQQDIVDYLQYEELNQLVEWQKSRRAA